MRVPLPNREEPLSCSAGDGAGDLLSPGCAQTDLRTLPMTPHRSAAR